MNQLTDFFGHLFDYGNWPPRWHCGKWSELGGWLYIVSDLLIWIAYFTIPIIIIKFIRKKQSAKFVKLYFLFAAFILACGATHFFDAIAFWLPLHNLSALVRLVTALISWVTVFYLYKLLPAAFALKTQAEMQQQVEEKNNELTQMLERVTDAFIAFDKNFCYTYLNQKAGELIQQNPNDLIGKNVWDIFPDAVGSTTYDSFNKAMKEQQYVCSTDYYQPLDLWQENHIYPSPNGLSVFIRDITQRKKMELQLEENEIKYRSIIEEASDGILISNPQGFYVDANARIAVMTGYAKEELLSMHSKDILFEEDASNLPPQIDRLKKDGKMLTERHLKKKDGSPLAVEISANVLPNGNFMGIVRDVAERKEAEEALRKSDERFTLLAQATTDMIWDWDLVTNHVWRNDNFYQLFNIPKETSSNVEIWMNSLHPDDKERVITNIQGVINSEQQNWTEEYRLVKTDGSVVNIYDRGHILYDSNRKPSRMIGSMLNISQQKKHELQVEREKQLSDSIINSLPGIFYLYDTNGKFIRWNRNFETVTGFTHEEISKMHPLDFFGEDEKQLLTEKIGNVFVAGEDNVEAHFLCKDGRAIPYYFTGKLVHYEDKQCLIGVGFDVTDRLKAEQQAKEADMAMYIALNRINDSVVSVDNEWHYTFLNDAALNIHPLGREGTLGKHLLEIHPEMANSELWANYKTAMQTKQVMELESYYEPLNFWALVKIYPSIDGLTFFYKDITEKKQAEQQLKESESKYRLLFDNNPLPMWMIDVETLNIIDVNEAAIVHYGYSRQEFTSMNIRQIRPAEDVAQMEETTKKINHKLRKAGIWNHLKKDGSIIKVEITSHDIQYKNQPTRLILANDVTDKVKAEDAMKKLNDELRQLYARQQKIKEEERKHIAREIHDELGQLITGLKMDISWLKKKIVQKQPELEPKINETIDLLDESVKTIRKISSELRPGILDDLGIVDALAWLAKDFEKRTQIKCLVSNHAGNIDCSIETKVVLFRIFQETLTNVMRHAQATQVDADISRQPLTVTMQISDNGKGFDVAAKTKTLGLLGMKERIANINGELYISSAVGRGTSVTIILPL